MKGPANACVYPVSRSKRNLSDPTDSRTSFIGVNTGASASSTVETPGEVESGGAGTITGPVSPDDEEEVEEGRAPRTRECPESMSSEALRIHSLTHIPYHPGCKCCVAARKRDHKHPRRKAGKPMEVETISGASICAD